MILLLLLALLLPPDRVVVSLDRPRAESGETVVASVSIFGSGPIDLEVRPSWGGVVRWSGTVEGVRTISVPLPVGEHPYGLYSVEACSAGLCTTSEPVALGEPPPIPAARPPLLFIPIARA